MKPSCLLSQNFRKRSLNTKSAYSSQLVCEQIISHFIFRCNNNQSATGSFVPSQSNLQIRSWRQRWIELWSGRRHQRYRVWGPRGSSKKKSFEGWKRVLNIFFYRRKDGLWELKKEEPRKAFSPQISRSLYKKKSTWCSKSSVV